MAKVKGTGGQDILFGTDNDDEMYGLDGNDRLKPTLGADLMDGGQGSDTVDFHPYFHGNIFTGLILYSSPAVNIDLENAVQHGGFAEGDTFVSIENVGGSRLDDIIRGNSEANKLTGSFGNDFIEGRGGDDIISGDARVVSEITADESEEEDVDPGAEGFDDILDGGAGDDILFGDGGNDTLFGGADNDELFGGKGDDLLRGGSGLNALDGGSGFDTASYNDAAHGIQVIFSGSNRGIVVGQGGNTVTDTFENVERFIGSGFADTMTGSTLGETFDGGGGNDLLAGRGGADTLIGGTGTDTATYATSAAAVSVNLGVFTVVNGVLTQTTDGTGNGGDAQGDTLNGVENLIGSNFADSLTGNSLGNRLDGGASNDTILGDAGSDTLIGGTGINVLDGGAGSDTASYETATAGVTVSIAAANGTAAGTGLTDTLISIENITGSAFADQITGSSGSNTILAGAGDDAISGGAGADTMFGGSGIDTLTYAASSAGVTVTLSGPTNSGSGGDALGDTVREIENVIGSNFADTLNGDGNANRIEGGAGDDAINGGAGNDVIIGGSSTGPEALTGGLGLDSFVYLSRNDSLAVGSSPSDFILDFEVGQDKLDFSTLGINPSQILIQNQTSGGVNSSIVTEDLNGNGQADNGEFAVAVIINGAGFVTLQDMLL
jgi:Ca2+-binding RTX toxin-like protein